MADLINSVFFKDLSKLDPREVCRRALCTYNDAEGSYILTVWNDTCKIYPELKRAYYSGEDPEEFHNYFCLFAVHYLLHAKEIEPANQWVSEKDIPGGETFFRGPHEIPFSLITDRFGNDIDDFKNSCIQLSGTPISMANAAFIFKITPRIPVAVLYWAGDDEFPAESKIIYDRTIANHLPLDIIFALAVGICEKLNQT